MTCLSVFIVKYITMTPQ